MISVLYRIKQLAANLYRSWSESNCILTTVLESNTSRTIKSTRMFNDGLGFSPHARLNRVRERVPQRRSWSHLTRDCNGLFQRRSWSLTSRTIGTLQRRSWRSTSLTIEAKDFEEGLGVPPHLRQNPVPKLSQHKVLEFHLTCSCR